LVNTIPLEHQGKECLCH